MKICNGSICSECENFEHECNIPDCNEYCTSRILEVVDNFYNIEIVKECKDFKK